MQSLQKTSPVDAVKGKKVKEGWPKITTGSAEMPGSHAVCCSLMHGPALISANVKTKKEAAWMETAEPLRILPKRKNQESN